MAGKKKGARATYGRSAQQQGHSTGSKPSMAPVGASSMAEEGGRGDYRCSTTDSKATDSAAPRETEQLHIGHAVASAQNCKGYRQNHEVVEEHAAQQQHQAMPAMQEMLESAPGVENEDPVAHMVEVTMRRKQQWTLLLERGSPRSRSSNRRNTQAPAPMPSASELMAQLRSNTGAEETARLLVQIGSLAEGSSEHRSALLAMGAIPALLRLLEGGSERLQDEIMEAVERLVASSHGAERESIKGSIPQVVALLRHRNQYVQMYALDCLSHFATGSKEHAQCLVPAGVMPAALEVLKRGHPQARLSAAALLMHRATASGIGNEAVTAVAVPAVLAVLECGTVPEMMRAAQMLWEWTHHQEVVVIAVEKGAVSTVVPLLAHPNPRIQQSAAVVLHNLATEEAGAKAATVWGAVPALKQMLQCGDQLSRSFAAYGLQGIQWGHKQPVSIETAAGAIPLLVRQLACGNYCSLQTGNSSKGEGGSSSSSIQQAGDGNNGSSSSCNASNDEARGLALEDLTGDYVALGASEWRRWSASCLCAIAARGDTQCRTAMLAAGVVAASGAALNIQNTGLHSHVLQILQHLMADADGQREVITCLLAYLRNSRLPKTQAHAVITVRHLVQEDSFRAAMVAAGGISALVSLLGDRPCPTVTGLVANILSWFSVADNHVAALAKAGAILAMAQLLQDSLDAEARVSAARSMCNLAQKTSMHPHLVGVFPQLLCGMQGDSGVSAKVHLFLGHTLQVLARAGATSTLQAMQATRFLWEPLMATKCSKEQRYTAGALYLSVLGGSMPVYQNKHERRLLESMRFIEPDKPASQWHRMTMIEVRYA